MDFSTFLLFSATVIPLVCTPGPDILFIASQAVSAGTAAGFRATLGIILGYCVHSLLVALGLAAIVATSPMLFEAIRWVGITYLVYLAFKLVRAAMRPGGLSAPQGHVRDQLSKGFVTSLLNPKGMMVYLAILPQFMDRHQANATLQAVMLSLVFMFWCAVLYSGICIGLGRVGGTNLSEARRRLIDGAAGGMILMAAAFMALAHR
ncbi:LysE family translocator [Achromobacter animicus]|uniref:LysE family translocator n=1 Tax=Achromobacter animicus TaxID=1389935 RepID=UPI002449D84C|nr:LysE family translocator [Achromobacter animicus]MDH0683066.1 LysE family translocator [Achromobacter animicus]